MPVTAKAMIVLQVLLLLAGAFVLWRIILAPSARRQPVQAALEFWPIRLGEFLLAAWMVVAGFLVGGILGARFLVPWLPFDPEMTEAQKQLLGAGLGSQLGCLAGYAMIQFLPGVARGGRVGSAGGAARAGFLTFLVINPIVVLVGIAWGGLLEAVGVPVTPQTVVMLFENAESPALLAVMALFAVVIAPTAEELFFRGVLFRYFRGRWPRALAIAVPAVGFAALHVTWSTLDGLAAAGPIAALAICLSIAYERTGTIVVPILAHALFNLNSTLMILAGVPADF